MTRIISEFPKEELEVSDFHPGSEAEEFPIQIITPIFGGGTEPGENDLEMLIRPSSIRGHLRFWWRATRGAKFENASQLFDREGEVWGTPDNPSPVTIQVSQPSPSSLKQRKASDDYGFWSRYGPESYVLFPAREKASSLCKEGISFLLKVYWPKHEKLQYLRDKENEKLRRDRKKTKSEKIEDIGPDIKTAIWAWTNFGGIGSRTRRGCGALYCKKTAPQDIESIEKWYSGRLNSGGFGKQPQRAWPTLPAKILIGSSKGKPMDEWANVIDIMKRFRQGAGIGRNPGNSSNPKMPGRSFWPEPETIRKITRNRLRKHQPINFDLNDAFPRAEFGLPIVFHFKNGREEDDSKTADRDPPESELCPTGYKRMSSPIILRPIAFGDGSRAAPLIIRLNTEPLRQVELKVGGSTKGPFGPSVICNPKFAAYRNSPLSGLTKSGSALEAFVALAGKNGFKEVGI